MSEDDTITRLRDEMTTEQLMKMEDDVRSAMEHLRAARKILSELPGGSDVSDLDEFIEEGDAAIEILREARQS